MRLAAQVHLIEPKYAHNVGGALRACSVLGAGSLTWTGDRFGFDALKRLPREERMKAYRHVSCGAMAETDLEVQAVDLTPVCVELVEGAERLPDFEHPDRALYVFGPEDGGVPKSVRRHCHRFVEIPGRSCLNLAAAINVVLYDRCLQFGFPQFEGRGDEMGAFTFATSAEVAAEEGLRQ